MTWEKYLLLAHNSTLLHAVWYGSGSWLKVVPSWTRKYDLALSKNCIVRDLRLSQRFCWRFRSSGMWHCVRSRCIPPKHWEPLTQLNPHAYYILTKVNGYVVSEFFIHQNMLCTGPHHAVFGDRLQHCHMLDNHESCSWYTVWSRLKAHWQYEPARSYVLHSVTVLWNIQV
jgi:hypothetical protein